ncbi:MAG: hypothetical protein ACK5X3_21515 [Pseudomonadota bacterium]
MKDTPLLSSDHTHVPSGKEDMLTIMRMIMRMDSIDAFVEATGYHFLPADRMEMKTSEVAACVG